MSGGLSLARPLTERARLVIVDDHAIVRHGLRSMLDREADIEVVGEAADRESALETIARTRPDLVLLDLRLDGSDDATGLDVLAEITHRHPKVGTVVLTTFLDDRLVTEAMRRGAKGYVLKDVDVTELVKIIRTVRRGESAFDARSAAALVRSLTTPEPLREGLTAREHETLLLICQGLSNRRIGTALSISESTVKFHVRNLMRKLGVGTRAEVVYEATRLDLL